LTPEVKQFIENCLKEDEKNHIKKQTHTAKRIYDRLVSERSFTGGESTVRSYVAENSVISEEEKIFITEWIKKTMHRAEKNDDEGNYRALAFLWESITDYFLLRDMFYFGSKKAVAYLKENDILGYRLYHDAITERTNAVIKKWAEYVTSV